MDRLKKSAQMKRPKNRFDKVDVTSRLINMVLDMSINDQLELLKQIDKSHFTGARRYVRKPYVFVVDCETTELYFQEYIRDISGGGVFLRTGQPFSAGQEIRITFQIPNHSHVFNILGKVVRTCKDGVGIKFIRHIALEARPSQPEVELPVANRQSA